MALHYGRDDFKDDARLVRTLSRERTKDMASVSWRWPARSEEHTSELQSLMRISYAVFCLKKKNKRQHEKHVVQEVKQMTKHVLRAFKSDTLYTNEHKNS